MRKHILIALSILFLGTSGLAYAYSTPSAVGEIKKVRGADQGEQTRVFKLVRYVEQAQNGASIVSGDAVVYSTVSADGISVTRSSTSADGAFAGIAVTTIPTSDVVQNNVNDGNGQRNWGYIQVHGMTTANITAGGAANCSAGDSFITSADAGQVSCFQVAQTAYLDGGQLNVLGRRNARGGFVYAAPVAATSTTLQVQVEKE